MKHRVLVVGDVMLDEFVYGDVHRISPEAATPVLTVKRIACMVGGAGNVARGIEALGGEVDLVGVVGDDEAGRRLLRELHKTEAAFPWIMVERGRKTTHKQRFVSDQHSAHLLRVDNEDASEIHGALEQSILNRAAQCLLDCSVLVLSDYDKGLITPTIARGLVDIAKVQEKLVIVDSKRADLSMFKGATIVKLNLCELGFCYDEPDIGTVGKAAHGLASQHDFAHVVVTRGENGLSSFSNFRGSPIHIPGNPVRVRDVSGAGDTVVATLATLLAGGVDLPDALERANAAAAIAVSKPGTAIVSLAELRGGTKIAPAEDWSLVDQRLREWCGKKIGFINGCFDLLHTGHLHLLTAARPYCDKLIVGINSDESVRAIKGEGRPVRSHEQRAEVLAALTDLVDLVVIFGDDPTPLIERIKPHAMFVGSDYRPEQVKGRDFAGTLHIIPRLPDVSTTETIERMSGLPPIDTSAYTPEVIARLQERALAPQSQERGPQSNPDLLKPWVPTGPAVERDRAVKEGCRYCDGGDDCTGACLNGHGKTLVVDDASRLLERDAAEWCDECHGPCKRRPRHGEFNI